MKYILSIILLSFILCNTIYAQDNSIYSTKTGYSLYKEKVKNICADYYKGKSELIYKLDETKSFTNMDNNSLDLGAGGELDKAKTEYTKNMDNIYSCANSITNYKSINFITEKLIANNPKLNSRLKTKLDRRKQQIETEINQLGDSCKIKSYSSNSANIKKSVLDQTSYELCRYTFYLDYLYDRTNLLETTISKNSIDANQGVSISYSLNQIERNKLAIINEKEAVMRIFPVVYKAYLDYENNITPHILLELVKEDYIVFRELLHKTLNPLSLLGYKLKNAMRK